MSKLDHGVSLGLLPSELIVDNFAGGGASLGIEMPEKGAHRGR